MYTVALLSKGSSGREVNKTVNITDKNLKKKTNK